MQAGLPEALSLAAAQKGNAHAVAAWLDEGGSVDAHCAEQCGATLLMLLNQLVIGMPESEGGMGRVELGSGMEIAHELELKRMNDRNAHDIQIAREEFEESNSPPTQILA